MVLLDKPVRVQRGDYVVTAQAVSDEVLARYEPILEQEWRRYPRSLMVRTKLGRIVVGADVRVQNQPRSVVPEFIPGWFWLVLAGCGGRLPPPGLRPARTPP